MGRGRGKGRKVTVARSHEDLVDGGEETHLAYKRRGRPQRPLKDDIDEDDIQKIEEDLDDVKLAVSSKDKEVHRAVEVKKRKRHPRLKESIESLTEENNGGVTSVLDKPTRTNGLRQNGSRRKSKPHRAAEVGVDWK